MDVSVIFQFLKNLATNNNREWFQEHKDEYLKAQKEFEELLTAIIARISLFDESIYFFPKTLRNPSCSFPLVANTS